MRTNIKFRDGGRTHVRMSDAYTDWLVELTSVYDEFVTDTIIVSATCFDEAVYNAFFTRNIASSWIVTEVEEA